MWKQENGIVFFTILKTPITEEIIKKQDYIKSTHNTAKHVMSCFKTN